MTMYRVSVGNREYQVEVSGNRLKLNGELIQANLTALNELGLYLLPQGDRQREMHVSTRGSHTFMTLGEGRHLVAQVEREDSRHPAQSRADHPERRMRAHAGRGDQGLVEVGRPGRKGPGRGGDGIDENADGAARPGQRDWWQDWQCSRTTQVEKGDLAGENYGLK